MMVRLVQLRHPAVGRRVALVDGSTLRLVNAASVYELAQSALNGPDPLTRTVLSNLSGETTPYDAVYAGASEWQILPSFHHPEEPARCLITGTGLTHKASADNRNAMHTGGEAELTDSMKMYRWGLEGGRPDAGQ